ncbi:DUF389 domain-containing protein [Kitasatospora kifunensis]|uniref:Putative hydrophobic protein (TIGR00271 family) n=1 Tax=Kitasatospora kifunensis TaxID=58351 RepID=A0A7W7R762_KITKI|nr:DUF389 domain-containing protein [Kitasatospora kifunensis]MBB4926687.1 putative hydrophobic protein (TIGR00271 family) [Kitasatospora kifunensis]
MLHLRLIVPGDLRRAVLDALDDCIGVAHVITLPGTARRPPGDVVLCDVARESADELLGRLRELGLAEQGAIDVSLLELSISAAAREAEREAPGTRSDALVWESVTKVTHEESAFSYTYLAFIVTATMLAACGVVLDSSVLIVGAMVVGPEFGPLAGFCVALVQRRSHPALRSLTALLGGFALAIALTILFARMMDAFGLFTEAEFDGPRPNTSFIFQPDALSLVVAFLGGVAGLLSLTSAKSGALVGVAISVTTVPAAANVAVALAYGDFGQARGSSVQLLLNMSGIVIAGVLTLLVQQSAWRQLRERRHAARRQRGA